jgi:hypothetical protein
MLTPDLKTRLRRSLNLFLEDSSPRTRELRRVATELSVLPITDDRDREFGIRLSDGKVVSFNRGEPYDPRVVDVPNAELALLAHAWIKFPELAPLVPLRPADAVACPACDGSGVLRHGERPTGFSCYCGGVGWSYRDGWTARSST